MDLLDAHRETLETWRHQTNLVGPGPLDPHYEDAQRALEGLDPVGRWADLGTGAGFPGIVLAAMYPELHVDLVDSRRKRCEFLEAVLEQADERPAPIRVVLSRIERLPDASYDGVTARALAKPPVVLSHAARLLRRGGRLALFVAVDADVPPHRAFRDRTERLYETSTHQRKVVVLTRA